MTEQKTPVTFEYYFKFREPGIGCQPSKGLISIHPGEITVEGHKFWGYATYDRILEDEEINRFDIYSICEIIDWNYQAKKQQILHIIAPIQYKKSAVQVGKPEKYFIVHPSSRPEYEWQVTYCDNKGPYSHHSDNKLTGILSDILQSGEFDLQQVEYSA